MLSIRLMGLSAPGTLCPRVTESIGRLRWCNWQHWSPESNENIYENSKDQGWVGSDTSHCPIHNGPWSYEVLILLSKAPIGGPQCHKEKCSSRPVLSVILM